LIGTRPLLPLFGDHISTQPESEYQYFSLQRGRSVLNHLCKKVDAWSGTVVDLGCGPGHMLNFMLERKIQCMGLDTSVNSISKANNRLSSDPHFLGARLMKDFDVLPLEDASVSGILLMETIEHLFTDKIPTLMAEIRRILKPGGFVFVTTPNNENLKAKEVVCTGCGCVFHPVQHMQSFDAAKLEAIMNRVGFIKQSCEPVIYFPDWRVYLGQIRSKLKILCPACGISFEAARYGVLNRIFNFQTQTLTYIGRR
jgi:SAM-dependent methyltransferase